MGRPDRALELEVIRRADGRCEYCHFPKVPADLPFHVDHIKAEKHGGATISGNLAWACYSCNLHKGPNIAGHDPITDKLTRLFHPRKDTWVKHFIWDGIWLRGITPVGRTTVAVLEINDPDSLAVREALIDEGFKF